MNHTLTLDQQDLLESTVRLTFDFYKHKYRNNIDKARRLFIKNIVEQYDDGEIFNGKNESELFTLAQEIEDNSINAFYAEMSKAGYSEDSINDIYFDWIYREVK